MPMTYTLKQYVYSIKEEYSSESKNYYWNIYLLHDIAVIKIDRRMSLYHALMAAKADAFDRNLCAKDVKITAIDKGLKEQIILE